MTEFEMSNYTFDEIPFAILDDFAVGPVVDTQCIQYTGDIYDNSEVCVMIAATLPSPESSCNVTYNDAVCSDCTISSTTFCLTANCTNVDPTYGTMVDNCERIGLDGPFQIVTVWFEADNSTFTTGSCDVDAPSPSTPVEDITSAPVDEAPSTPVEDAPSAPVEEAPAAPVEEAPAAPVVEAPSAPVSAPSIKGEATSAPVKAPSAPVKSPAVSPNAPAPTSDGNSYASTLSWSIIVTVMTSVTIFW
jgi:hypothetical protein